jgi:hypothetical protein
MPQLLRRETRRRRAFLRGSRVNVTMPSKGPAQITRNAKSGYVCMVVPWMFEVCPLKHINLDRRASHFVSETVTWNRKPGADG